MDKPTAARSPRNSVGDGVEERSFGEDSLNHGGLDDPDAVRFLALAATGDEDAAAPLIDAVSSDEELDPDDESEDEPKDPSYTATVHRTMLCSGSKFRYGLEPGC